ncbi:hypothetical protein P879_00296 [Paragonimus westermani]|uniref:Uncharacterized protein n=1 Tax=Paragonimus westermani TaxID=34504 RepID=A0A8T0DZ76_9TREM|nr:hypothetical protein P879_00296 [Paragonimus westermani]
MSTTSTPRAIPTLLVTLSGLSTSIWHSHTLELTKRFSKKVFVCSEDTVIISQHVHHNRTSLGTYKLIHVGLETSGYQIIHLRDHCVIEESPHPELLRKTFGFQPRVLH